MTVVALLGACTSDGSSGSPATTGTSAAPSAEIAADAPQAVTPVVASVPVAPIPFPGSDGMTHLVYELAVTNAGRATAVFGQLEVLDGDSEDVVATLDADALADALQLVNGQRTDGSLEAAQSGIVYLSLELPEAEPVPASLVHRLAVTFPDAPPGRGAFEELLAPVEVDDREVIDLGPPLAGTGYVAADGCCVAVRHRRATLPINGSLSIAQRYAVDWEQIDDQGRIWSGERTDNASYVIYGKEALAVGDGTVVRVIDGLPEQVPGTMPEDISVEEADGNSVIIDLGGGYFVMYAHLQPGSIRVAVGDTVARGDVLGLVGNSGNSLAPHLHLHVMDSPLPLASSGLPYTIDAFTASGQTVSTEAFDRAEAEGTPLEYTPFDPPTTHRRQYPMDQWIVTFG